MMFCSSVLTARTAQSALSTIYAKQTALLGCYIFHIRQHVSKYLNKMTHCFVFGDIAHHVLVLEKNNIQKKKSDKCTEKH